MEQKKEKKSHRGKDYGRLRSVNENEKEVRKNKNKKKNVKPMR